MPFLNDLRLRLHKEEVRWIESRLHPHTLLLNEHFNIIFPKSALSFFNFILCFSSALCILHAILISSSLIWSHHYKVVDGKSYEAFHYVILSILSVPTPPFSCFLQFSMARLCLMHNTVFHFAFWSPTAVSAAVYAQQAVQLWPESWSYSLYTLNLCTSRIMRGPNCTTIQKEYNYSFMYFRV